MAGAGCGIEVDAPNAYHGETRPVEAAGKWVAECRKQKNTRGGGGVPGMQAYVMHIPYGRAVGALPSGRLAGKPISDGASPCPGSDTEGPTAVMKSLSKVNGFEQNMTDILNMTLHPSVFANDEGGPNGAGQVPRPVSESGRL